ncbi:MAG: hypothetical protein NTV86_06905 [Planctomycetota bacterium]|nr:hypothetical protein [Planctomycetota bacterium]
MMRSGMVIVALTVTAGLAWTAPATRPARQPDIRLSAIVDKVDLTGEQKAQVAAVADAAQADADKEPTPDGKFLVWTKAVTKIKADILTEAQRKKYEDTPASIKPGMGLMSMAERLGLSDEQRVQVKGLIAGAEASAQKASTPGDRHKIWMDAFEDIQKKVLTPDQQARLNGQPMGAKPGTGLASMLMSLNLSKEQETKIAAMMSDSETRGAKAKTVDEKNVIRLEVMEEIKKSVLTEEQRKKLEVLMSMAHGHGGMGAGSTDESPVMEMLKDVGMNDDQKARARAIIKAATEHAATMPDGGGDGHAVWKKAFDEIRRTVLTEEQRKRMPSGMGPVRMSVRALMAFEKLSLTDQQHAKIKTLLEAGEDQCEKCDTREAAQAIWTKTINEVKKNVLTESQRKALDQ